MARETLEEAGFLVEVVRTETEDPEQVGVVLHQDPDGGIKAKQGTTVILEVGAEPDGGEGGGGGGGGGPARGAVSRRAWP
jgi:beta-lactam-binding protein with PASTA domain